ncbi:MAG: DEAD/DEAH box helicase [Polyangiaceae bacterium]
MSNSSPDVAPRGEASQSSHFSRKRFEAEAVSLPPMPETSSCGFSNFGFGHPLLRALAELGHEEPTPIQRKAMGPALSGRDVLGCAQTGTGKTAAFTLPLLQRLCAEPVSESGKSGSNGRAPIRALVLAPTRELASQIDESLSQYGQFCRFKHAKVFGGVGLEGQVRTLRRGVDVLVATPGRLEDLMKSDVVDLSSIEMLVLDEVDRMLDQGFLPAVTRITNRTPRTRQTLLFSATMPDPLRQLARSLMRDPIEVAADVVASTPVTIEQVVYNVPAQYKRTMLEHLVIEHQMTRALVFTRTKHGADRVARHLKAAGIGAEALHGGKTQSVRERSLAAFRSGEIKVLVATDLAARGIHVDGISHVINFDLPLDAENYVHRIGRTARAGESGVAFSLCSPEERDVLRRVEKLIRRRLDTADPPDLFARTARPPMPTSTSNVGAPPSASRNDGKRGLSSTYGHRGGVDAREQREAVHAVDGATRERASGFPDTARLVVARRSMPVTGRHTREHPAIPGTARLEGTPARASSETLSSRGDVSRAPRRVPHRGPAFLRRTMVLVETVARGRTREGRTREGRTREGRTREGRSVRAKATETDASEDTQTHERREAEEYV